MERLNLDIDLTNVIVHMVRIVEIQLYSVDFFSSLYPDESEYAEIENYTKKIMKNTAKEIGIDENNLITKCFFELNREEKIIEYLKDVHADLVVTATRGKHGIEGFFSSSFTNFLCKFSPCDLLVIHQEKK